MSIGTLRKAVIESNLCSTNEQDLATALKLAGKCGAFLGMDQDEINERINLIRGEHDNGQQHIMMVTPEEEEEFAYRDANESKILRSDRGEPKYKLSSMSSIADDYTNFPDPHYDGYGMPEKDIAKLAKRGR